MPSAQLAPLPIAAPAAYHYQELPDGDRVRAHALAEECALALSCNGVSQAVMMVSPNDLEDFAAGFCIGQGLVGSIDEIYDIQLHGAGDAREARLQLSNRAFWALKRQRRLLAGSTGCGLCGVAALDQALPELPSLPGACLPPPQHLHQLRQRIAEHQCLARDSGALHAALFVDADGRILLCREDIGRHNALDKLIGALARQRLMPAAGFAVVTSRCSLELIHKAVRAGLSTLVSLSAPSSLTVDWARRLRLNLIHLPDRHAPRVYSPAPVAGAGA